MMRFNRRAAVVPKSAKCEAWHGIMVLDGPYSLSARGLPACVKCGGDHARMRYDAELDAIGFICMSCKHGWDAPPKDASDKSPSLLDLEKTLRDLAEAMSIPSWRVDALFADDPTWPADCGNAHGRAI